MIPALFNYPAGVFGNLYITGDDAAYPPSMLQVQRAVKEIHYFCLLIKSHALDPFPDDSPFIKVLQQAVKLYSLCIPMTRRWSNQRIFSQKTGRKDEKLAHHCWEESAMNCDTAIYIAEKLYADDEHTGKSSESLFQLSCISPLLKSCLNLISTWINRVPRKKLRWRRLLQDSLKPFLNELLSQCQSKLMKGDEFAESFGSVGISCDESDKLVQMGKMEVVGLVMVEIIISSVCIQVQQQSTIPTDTASTNKEIFHDVRMHNLKFSFVSVFRNSNRAIYLHRFGKSYQATA